MKFKKSALLLISIFSVILLGTTIEAAPMDGHVGVFGSAGWTEFANDDGIVGPGGGGQDFDAEYLFYKVEGNTLSIGLQTGFNVVTGKVSYGGKPYFAGDLALSFDGDASTTGDSSTYEYAIDFGLMTKDYYLDKVGGNSGTAGIDNAGVYLVSPGGWNNDVIPGHSASNPFAMESGNLVTGLLSNTAGYDASVDSYYRIVSFDVSSLGGITLDDVDVHWTMSCGNDAINGNFSSSPVPEPATMLLLGGGLLGMLGMKRKKTEETL